MAPPKVIGPTDGRLATLGMTGARFLVDGDEAGKRFALVEHPMQPRALAAPSRNPRTMANPAAALFNS